MWGTIKAVAEPVPAEEAARRFPEIVESVAVRRERVTITTPSGGDVVLMNADDLESLEETLALLDDPEAIADIREGIEAIRGGDTHRLDDVYPRDV
jgi:prevent-host-death family protein